MKKILSVVFALLTAMVLTVSASQAKEKQIYIIHEDTPSWVIETIGKNAKTYWFTDQYAYGVGIAPPMKNSHLQMSTAESRARTNLTNGLRTNGVISSVAEVRGHWKDPDTKKAYILVRTPIKIIPAER